MGTRGGRPEPQVVTARGKNAARGAGKNKQRPQVPAARTPEPAAAGREIPGPPRWFQLTTLALALVGMGLSVYLTISHYTDSAPVGCPENSTINCVKVTTSPESMVFGIFPVAVLGLAFYVFMVAVTTPWAWRARADRPAGQPARFADPAAAANPWARLIGAVIRIVSRFTGLVAPAIPWARLISVVIGIGFVLYLIYVELFLVDAICLWCTGVHAVTFVLFAFIVGGAASWGLSRPAAGRE
jgi:uncharacterized membrane protein